MVEAGALAQGRQAFDRRAWSEAFRHLSAADGASLLPAEDLERLAIAAYLAGHDPERDDALARAHQQWLESGSVARAARSAFWLAFGLLGRGELAPGSGWLARARRLLDDHQLDCVEQGYLLIPLGLQSIDEGDAANAYGIFDQAAKFAERFNDLDLLAMARFGTGLALLRLGEMTAGMAHFDETMVSLTVGELSVIVVGIVYCGVIQECYGVFDVRRAHEWTVVLSRWCDEQSDLVPFRGQCLVHRSQLLQLSGAWPEAMQEAQRAQVRLTTPPGQPALGMALHQQAELLRLRGAFTSAEAAYYEAGQLGHPIQPGMALLQLAEGRIDAAAAAIRVCLDQTRDRLDRARVLTGYVEIVLADNDIAAARATADELTEIASGLGTPYLRAVAARANGAVLLAEGLFGPALTELRRACAAWLEINAPYELARTRELTGLAYRAHGDSHTAQLEIDAARMVYERVGATTDLARLSSASATTIGELPSAPNDGLTSREREVLVLVAAGKSNRKIADELTLSEHTVARHVQNILAKLDLPSRTAASAYAYQHGLIGRSHSVT